MGNQLAPGTLDAMAGAFERSTGTLAERLLKALIAGEKAGGQISGKQSAALLVKGIGHEWYNQIDLRVDHSRDPFADLQRLLNYHYGRIRINQATFALNNGHQKRGDSLLNVAVMMTKGWYGIYPRIAKAYLRMGKTQKALELIKAAVKAEPKWKENLSAFYMLYSDPELQSWYPESNFTLIDWNNAIDMLISLDRNEEAMTLARRILKKHPESSYTWYLLACAYQQKGSITEAREADSKALRFDPDNGDARRLAAKLSDHI
jgi:tetratricopeptide (TPR) repeat protein